MTKRHTAKIVLTLFVAAVLVLGVTSSVEASSKIGYVQRASLTDAAVAVTPDSVAESVEARAAALLVAMAAEAAEVQMAELTELAVVTTSTTLAATSMNLVRQNVTTAQMRQMARANFD